MAEGININTSEVSQAGKALAGDASTTFATTAQRGAYINEDGEVFGTGIGFGNILVARNAYQAAHTRVRYNVEQFQLAVSIIAEAAQQIATDFKGADLTQEQQQKAVEDVLNAAAGKVNALQQGNGNGGL
jgi:hypothetical protein